MQSYDAENGFYQNDSLHNVFRYSLIAMTVIVFAAAYIYIKEGKNQISLPESRIIRIVSFFPVCVFTGFAVYCFAKLVLPMFERPGVADIVMMLLSIVSVLFFLSYEAKEKLGDSRALLCSAPAIVLLALVFGLYFNPKVSYINHSVVLAFATSIFLMLTTLAEANSILKRPALRRYLAYAPTAIVLSFALSIPDIIFAITNLNAPISDIYYDIIILSLGVYHLARLTAIALEKPIEEEEAKK